MPKGLLLRALGTAFILALLARAAFCQVPPPLGTEAQSKPDQLCTVEGTLVKSTTGEPAKKVTIALAPFGGQAQTRHHTTTADTYGHFLFQDVEPGKFTLHAGGEDYPNQTYREETHDRHWKIITLEPGQHEKDIVFKLAPGAVIAGSVYDENGDPVIGANVQAFLMSRRGGVGGAGTDDRGEYRVFGLEAGRYLLMAEIRSQNESGDDRYLPAFYPGTTDKAQATAIEVHPGDELAAINLIMKNAHGVRVRGRVINLPVSKDRNIAVQLVSSTAENWYINFNSGVQVEDERGDFEIKGVPPGSYFAVARYFDRNNKMLVGHTPFEAVNVDLDNVVVALNPSFDLRGRARTEGSAPLDFSGLNILLQARETQWAGGGRAEIKADGTFVIHNLYDGNYRVYVGGHPEEFYLKSARLGDQDALASEIPLTGTQAGSSLEIVLSRNGGTLSGTVLHDSQPVPGALVTLVPDPPNRNRQDLFDSKIADEFGRFTLLGLPPGDFKIFAWDPAQDVNLQDPEFLKQYEDRGKSVHVEERCSQSVQLESIPAVDEAQ